MNAFFAACFSTLLIRTVFHESPASPSRSVALTGRLPSLLEAPHVPSCDAQGWHLGSPVWGPCLLRGPVRGWYASLGSCSFPRRVRCARLNRVLAFVPGRRLFLSHAMVAARQAHCHFLESPLSGADGCANPSKRASSCACRKDWPGWHHCLLPPFQD